MITQIARSTLLVAAIALSSSAFMFAHAEENDFAALAAALKDTKVTLGDGFKTSEREGKPVSAKFEFDDGKLQLSVYARKPDGFAEVVIDPKTGAITKAEKITDAEDLEAAAAQTAAMEKATVSLLAAFQKAVVANPGHQGVSITPEMKEGHPIAEITLLQGEAFKKVAEKLD